MRSFPLMLTMLLLIFPVSARSAKPVFQYESDGIEITVPSADEPRVERFNADAIQRAAQYLDDGAIAWVRGRACINCHTTGPYLAERPGLSRFLGTPKDEVRENFAANVPLAIDDAKPAGSTNSVVWRTLGLAEWDRHVAGKRSEETDRSLADMFRRQSADGSFLSTGEVEIPYITTDFELTVQAARAVVAAPDWLASLSNPDLKSRVERMKTFLRDSKPRNDYERVLRLQLASVMPELVPRPQRDEAMELLTRKQHADGGWSLRDMSATDNWRTPMSDTVLKLIASLPDADRPESDPYMTAFAIVTLREVGVPASDERIRRGIDWLKREQRTSGRWWMHSLYRGNYHFITYIATAQAMKALALSGELDALEPAAPNP